jgi:hypothetical protein
MRSAAVKRGRAPSRAAEAFWELQLACAHAPEPARIALRSELRAMGLRAPGDPEAPPSAISADVRPGLFARSAGTTIVPWLTGTERALALAAIETLTTPASRRGRVPTAEEVPTDG